MGIKKKKTWDELYFTQLEDLNNDVCLRKKQNTFHTHIGSIL